MTSSASGSYPTSVYKYFDEHDILIYVGITRTGVLRNRQHNSDKAWWSFVARQEVEHFEDRATAHEREIALIQRYRPAFNAQHNCEHEILRAAYEAMRARGTLGRTAKQILGPGVKHARLFPIFDPALKRTAFISHIEDAGVWALVKIPNGSVPVIWRNGKVGHTRKFTKDNGIARLGVDWRLDPPDITSALARFRVLSLKSPAVVELKSLDVFSK